MLRLWQMVTLTSCAQKHRGAQLRSVLEGLGVPLMEASLSLSDMLWVVRPVDGIGGELVMKHGCARLVCLSKRTFAHVCTRAPVWSAKLSWICQNPSRTGATMSKRAV